MNQQTGEKPAVAAVAAAKPAGDARIGMSFWNTATFITAGASDLIKPVADLALFFLIGCLIGAGLCVYLTFFRKPPMPYARTALGTLGLGVAVFGFFILARLATPEGIGNERGVIAAYVPPIADVQAAVLPLTPVEKELLTLSTRLSSGDPEARSAAARAALTETEDKATRRAMLERILRNSDPNVKQAGLVQALKERGMAELPILPDRSATGPLAASLTGAQLRLTSVNLTTGGVGGALVAAGNSRVMSGSVANGRLVVAGELNVGGKLLPNASIDVAVDDRLQLVGEARLPSGESVKLEIPFL